MANLSEVISELYTALKGENTTIYNEYERLPVAEHEDIYAVCGISKITLENGIFAGSAKYYDVSYRLNARILALPETDPLLLYQALDTQFLDALSASGYAVKTAEISAPYQDKGLRRLVLECTADISGRTEVINESQSE